MNGARTATIILSIPFLIIGALLAIAVNGVTAGFRGMIGWLSSGN